MAEPRPRCWRDLRRIRSASLLAIVLLVLPSTQAAAASVDELTDEEYTELILQPVEVEKSAELYTTVGAVGAGVGIGGFSTGVALVLSGLATGRPEVQHTGGVLMGSAGVIGLSLGVVGFAQAARVRKWKQGETSRFERHEDLLPYQRFTDGDFLQTVGGSMAGSGAILAVMWLGYIGGYTAAGLESTAEVFLELLPAVAVAAAIDVGAGLPLLILGKSRVDDVAWEVRGYTLTPPVVVPWVDAIQGTAGLAVAGRF